MQENVMNKQKSKLKKEIEATTKQPLKALIHKYYKETGSAEGVAQKLSEEMKKEITPSFIYYWIPRVGLRFERKLIG